VSAGGLRRRPGIRTPFMDQSRQLQQKVSWIEVLRKNTDPGLPTLPSRIVVRGTNWVGDTIMSLPAAREIRRIFPAAAVTLWVKSGLAALVKAAGVADDIISFGKESGSALRRPFGMRKKLVTGKYQLAIMFQNAFESAFTAWVARIPGRAGFPTDLRGPLLTIKVPLPESIQDRHQVFYYLAITEFLEKLFHGYSKPVESEPDCSIYIGMERLAGARDLLLASGAEMTRPIFCLCPGSVNSDAKRWPVGNFARLADLLIEELDGQVAYIGSPEERHLIDGITSRMKHGGTINLAGESDIMTSMAVMNLSRMVISNDTGSAHLAVAASAKVLTLFGPTIPGATAPFGPNAFVLQSEAPCSPCRHFNCPEPDHSCMTDITPETVLRRIENLISNTEITNQSGIRS
jgi:lipopolysaccharide heptosyltransferase II